MKSNKIKFSLLILVIFSFGFLVKTVFSYDSDVAHPYITEKAIELFNKNSSNKLSAQEIGWVRAGSIEEDAFLRYLNHFYDPTTGAGLGDYLSAKDWSVSPENQKYYLKGDQTWKNAIDEYVKGNKKEAFIALGHILHLIEDMSVPAHTRNDQHVEGDPYEGWVKTNNKLQNLNNISSIGVVGLNEAFDGLATYSNSNFLSSDTLGRANLENKNTFYKSVGGGLEVKCVEQIIGNKSFCLAVVDKEMGDSYFYINHEYVHSDYYSLLAPKAISYSAGVIDLFFEEVEKAKKEKQEQSWWDRLMNIVSVNNQLAIAPNLATNNTKSGNDVDNLVDNGLVDFSGEGQNDGVGEEVVDNNQPNSDDNSQENENNLGNQDGNRSYNTIENPNLISNLTPNQPLTNYSAGFGGGGSGGGSNENNQSGEENNQNNQDNAENQGQNDEKNENNITETINSPTITSPLNNQKFNQNSIEFYGTASSTNIIYSDFSNATTTADEEGQWSLVLEDFEQGTTTVNFFATNITQTATSSETSIEIFVDSQAPATTLTVAECKDSLLKSDCLLAVTTVTINAEWSVDNSDFAYFILNKNGEKIETTATTTQIKINGNQDYRLAVSAVDDMGNVSEEAEQIIQINNAPVVINEIAWAGTSRTTSSDEWIELYNNTNEPIDLTGWTLYAEDKEPHIKLFGSIPANDYYLLERTDDTTVSDMQADLIYTGALSNSGEHLFLSFNKNNATTTVDEILKANNWGQNGNSVAYNTMERYDSHVAGTDWNNWGGATTRQYLINGKDANNESIFGTPKKRNSVNYLIDMSNELSVNKTLTKENSPYFIPEFSFRIKEGATLTIEEGVVIKFSPQGTPSFTVDGTIKSKGTKENPVVFTALYDDEYGGDMNNDGICEPENASSTSVCPVVGSWRQIFVSEKSKDSVFENTIVRYGGHYLTGQAMKYKSMLTVENTDILINDSVFENSLSRGVYLINTGSDTEILGNIFRNNNYDETLGATYPYGLDVSDGAPLIENNLFENNGYGLHISGSSAVVNSNEFKNNFKNAILSSGPVRFYNNSGDGNKINGIVIGSDITEVGMTNIMKKNQLPYVLYDTGVNVVASSTLKIDPGVVIKFGNEKFVIEGSLEMGDLNGERVLFTSYVDNSDGTNVFGLEQPEEIGIGKWTGTYLEDGSISTIKNAEFRYMKYGLKYENSAINLENVMFKNNDQAIFADEGSFVQTAQNIIFEGNIATSTVPL
ncbi:hypothetical protein A3I18_01260 [Candidatus Campbellbacteria bacterium RIFCSPLOWO2_02_FULL_35_11]|uniref:Phospholipase C n=1 Tax=Candidatus Campbellbacteria bacterium RIFCSPLOWO2_02_FULL_35_11 TaxID=1797581 RepID=A0A1F5ET86_9BACT|nr:MAG: hypothetical protein A3I18_01260 [Candidatus Campbellbacteria bacterium RIFCSPLOWO2_02_FULL_35_11]